MYLYSIYGYEENTVLKSNDKYSDIEFAELCRKAEVFDFHEIKAYSGTSIKNYLIKNYGFKPIKYTAGFFIDADIKD